MYQVYIPRIRVCKSQSKLCKLKQFRVDNRNYSNTGNTIKYNETGVNIDYNGLTTILALIKGLKNSNALRLSVNS